MKVAGFVLPAGIANGLVISIVSFIYAFSYAALICSGDLSGALPFGITTALVTTAVIGLAVALLSPLKFAIAGPDSNASAVLAASFAVFARGFGSDASPYVVFTNVLIGLSLATVLTGVLLFVLGAARAGHWIRFIPFSVVGGFLAAAAWFMIFGSLRIISGGSFSFAGWSAGFSRTVGLQLGVALLWTAILFFAGRRFKHPLTLGALIVAGTLVTDFALHLAGVSFEQARLQGWLFDIPAGSAFWQPWSFRDVAIVDWHGLAGRSVDLITVALVSTLTILFNLTAAELVTRSEIDIDRELRVEGIANVASALAGGFIGYVSLTRTALNFTLGTRDRVAGVVVALSAALMAFGGMFAMSYVPKFVLAGVILQLGLVLMYRWLIASRRRVSLADYLAIVAILAVIVQWGFVTGIVTGFVLGSLIFVFSSSRVKAIKHVFSGLEMRSNVEWSPAQTAILQAHGNEITIVVLQGFLFFGLADRIYKAVKDEHLGVLPRMLVLDFRAVQGIDGAAISSLVKIYRAAHGVGCRMMLAGMSHATARAWAAGADDDAKGVAIFEDLDEALEHCELDLIGKYSDVAATPESLAEWLAHELGGAALAERLIGFLKTHEFAGGDYLCRQGDPGTSLFFVERGRIGVYLEHADGTRQHLRSMASRTIVGEMGLYRTAARSASMVAESDSTVHELSDRDFAGIEQGDSQLAGAVHSAIVRMLADRVAFGNSLLAALQE